MKVVRILFFCLIVFLAMPEFVVGGPALMNGIRARGDVWSVRHDYFGDAAFMLIAGALAIGFAAWGAFRPGKANWLRFLVATSIVFLMAVSIPSWYAPPEWRGRSTMISRMRALDSAVKSWGAERGTLPLTDSELREAAKAGDVRLGDSPFQRGSASLPLELALNASATGATLRAERPGVLTYGVDAAGRRYWISGTGLPAAVASEAAVIGENGSGGPPLVLEGALESPAPPSPAGKQETKKK